MMTKSNDEMNSSQAISSKPECVFPLEFYHQVQDTIESILTADAQLFDQQKVDHVFSMLSHFLHLNYGRLYIYNNQSNSLEPKYGSSIKLDALERGIYAPGEGVTGQAFLAEEATYVWDLAHEPQYQGRSLKASDLPYKEPSYLAVPFYGKNMSGVIGFHLGKRGRADILATIGIVSTMAECIGNSELPFFEQVA